jgi:anti-sigma B factor antagonist
VSGADWTGAITEEYYRITVDEPADPEFLSIRPAPARLCRPAWFPGYRVFRRGGWLVTDVTYSAAVINGVPVVAAPAEIDITNADGLRSALLTAAANGHSTLVVDMTQTRFCDSSGLHALVAAHRRARADGREVLLVIPGTAVLRVFAITGMDQVIPNFTSLDEALAEAAATANGRQQNEADAGPKTIRPGLTSAGELPGTLKRSSTEAQETFIRALAGAVQVYGERDQANRAAYVEFKRTFEKRGDHWIPKQPSIPGVGLVPAVS